VLLIRIGFSADPDPAFNLNADPNPKSKTNAFHDSGQRAGKMFAQVRRK
jgi:hypothetical protein